MASYGLSNFDVSNLNEAMRGLGNTFVVNRQQQENKRQALEQELVRREMLKNEQKRTGLLEEQQNRAEAGTVNAWLTGDDGGTVHFSGPKAGLDKIMQEARAKGKTLRALDAPPSNKPQYGVYTGETPLGTLQLHLESEADLKKAMELAKQLGAHPRTSLTSSRPAAALQITQGIQEHIDAANEAQAEGDTATAEVHRQAAELLTQHLKKNPPKETVGWRSTTTRQEIGPEGTPINLKSTTEKTPVPIGGSSAPGAVAKKLVRDPKTGKLVPQK